jgi:lysozyme
LDFVVNDELFYDHTGLELTAHAEGVKLTAYRDSVGVLTIGVGHTGPDVFEGQTITYDEAMNLLAADVHAAEEGVKKYVKVQLTQNQFDALVDFAFNLGVGSLEHSTLLRLVNLGDFLGASGEFQKWVTAGGHKLPGLVARRAEEAHLFEA